MPSRSMNPIRACSLKTTATGKVERIELDYDKPKADTKLDKEGKPQLIVRHDHYIDEAEEHDHEQTDKLGISG